MREHYFDLESVELVAERLYQYDCIIIATDHDVFDYAQLQREARLIVDTRGRLQAGANVVHA